MNLKLEEQIGLFVQKSVELDATPGRREDKLLSIQDCFAQIQQNLGVDIGLYFKDIMMALLNNKFSVGIKQIKLYNEIIYFISSENNSLTLEPDMLTRFILSLEVAAALSDVILQPANRIKGFETMFSLYKKRPFFQFLKLVEAETIEIIVLLTLIEFSINESHNRGYEPQQLCKYLPKALFIEFYNRLVEGSSVIVNQQLVHIETPFTKDCYFLTPNPRTYKLLGGRDILPID